MRILIIDDEPPARRRLRRLLSEYADIREVVELAGLPEGGAPGWGVDLVFLDIQLQDTNGLEAFARRHRRAGHTPHVIVVTAYAQYAVGAFAVDAVDYLLKPVTRERLAEAMSRVQRRREVPSAGAGVRDDQAIAVHDRGRLLLLRPAEVEYFAAAGNYIRVHTSRGVLLHRERIHELEARLDPALFVRIHRSVIVNTRAIAEVWPWMNGDQVVRLTSGAEVRWSRHYRRALEAWRAMVTARRPAG